MERKIIWHSTNLHSVDEFNDKTDHWDRCKVGHLFKITSGFYVSPTLSNPTVSPFHLLHLRLGLVSMSHCVHYYVMVIFGSIKDQSVVCFANLATKQTYLLLKVCFFYYTLLLYLIIFTQIFWVLLQPHPSPRWESKYFVVLVDDCSQFTWINLFKQMPKLHKVYIAKRGNEVIFNIQNHKSMWQRQCNKILRHSPNVSFIERTITDPLKLHSKMSMMRKNFGRFLTQFEH